MSKFTNSDLILDNELVDFEILFCNLEGRAEGYNDKGDRNFRVKFNNDEFAKALAEDGWNIKIYTPKNDKYDPYYYLDVKVKFRVDSPRVMHDPEIHMLTPKNDILLKENNVGDLDAKFRAHEVISCNLVLNPYPWVNPNFANGEGITAYLKEMWADVKVSPFAERYANRNSTFDDDFEVPFD